MVSIAVDDVWVGLIGALLASGLIAAVWGAQYFLKPDGRAQEVSMPEELTRQMLQSRPRDAIETGHAVPAAKIEGKPSEDAYLIEALHAEAAQCRSDLGSWDLAELGRLLLKDGEDAPAQASPRKSIAHRRPVERACQPSSSTRV